ncbi:recombinase family protein [Crystallibacter degradans]|uniref:recombinase family protein n=1 Tax=Crystallibacter degradans TaxID=2726743 RepID=UPI001475C450|nr:recombinase family protein [Arthrobacter sp. SF27]NMR29931.1 recombinase family protein [Arthrobacter sp. SF27]
MAQTVQSCGIYARISRDDVGTALGVARQIDDCTAEAARRGWALGEVFTDNDVSATRVKKRPAYERLLHAIETGAVDAVIVWDVDRLTRTPAELERFIDLADCHHLALASIGGEVDLATPQGRLTARIKGSVARHEVEQLSRRLKRKFQENAQGGKSHGMVPFGYRRERVTDEQGRDAGTRDVLEPAEAQAIRELYAMAIAGDTLRYLAKHLNERGFRTSRGNPFQGNVVGNMLRKPRYAGHRTYQGQIIGKGDWDPIISQDTYDQALAVLTAPGRRHSRGIEPKYLLSGIALCGRCSEPTRMRPNIQKARDGRAARKPAYVCPGCTKVTRMMEPVDAMVEAVIVEILSRSDVMEHVSETPDALRAATGARDAVLARMDTAADEFADGAMTGRQFARINERLGAQLATAEANVAKLQPSSVLDGMTGAGAAEAWQAASVNRKREIIRELATVTILPSGTGVKFAPDQVKVEPRKRP